MEKNIHLTKLQKDQISIPEKEDVFHRQRSIKNIQNDSPTHEKDFNHWEEYKIRGKTITRKSYHTAISYNKT